MNSKRRNHKSRAKPKKPKFLSLGSLQIPTNETTKTKRLTEMRPVAPSSATDTKTGQLNLFPSHLEDLDNHDHENVACFFSAAYGGDTTLTGLLGTSTAAVTSNSSHATNNITSRMDDLSPSSVTLTYAYRGHDSNPGAVLVRNALRNRERDSSEDKWVCYSEVVERKVKEEEVTSSAVDLRPAADDRIRIQRLALKLDYQEIMEAWSDKGPLYIHDESAQIVPDVNDDFLMHEASNNGWAWGCNVVPKMVGNVDQTEEELRMWEREASVLRYKEKRRKRLFSKKIRYEVRKLNAQKRPRLKGRFVKRS